jgi:hypothetical protein
MPRHSSTYSKKGRDLSRVTGLRTAAVIRPAARAQEILQLCGDEFAQLCLGDLAFVLLGYGKAHRHGDDCHKGVSSDAQGVLCRGRTTPGQEAKRQKCR